MKVYTIMDITELKTKNWTMMGNFTDLEAAKTFIEVPNSAWDCFDIHKKKYEVIILEQDIENNRQRLVWKSKYEKLGFCTNLSGGDSGYMWSIDQVTYRLVNKL